MITENDAGYNAPVFNDAGALLAWMKQQARELSMRVEVIPIADVLKDKNWKVTPMDDHGRIQSVGSGQFSVIGTCCQYDVGREEPGGWVQLHLQEKKGPGRVAMLVCHPHVLIRAKAINGSNGIILDENEREGVKYIDRNGDTHVIISPTGQFSLGNVGVDKAEGKEPIPFEEMVNNAIGGITPCIDGARHFGKTNNFTIVHATREEAEEQLTKEKRPQDFAWVKIPVLFDYVEAYGGVDEYVFSTLANLLRE